MSSLSHHGIRGQKWGVRRYQNYDGTRTALGKRRDFERTASKVVEDLSNSPQPFVRRPFNKDKIRQRGLITQAEADQCAGLAAGVFKQASQVEPQITGDVIDVVSSTSAKMYGLNNRLKQPTSIAAKIGADAKADGVTFEQAAGGLKDVIRYTAVSDSRDYVDTYNAIKQRLEEKGYTETKCKNYFQKYQNGEVMHKAVQSTFRSPDGVEFEFQFQTPESQAAKELKVPIYNERRKAGNTPERNAELEQEMRNLAEQVPDPEGVFGIESHSGVKNMKHSSMTGDGMLVVNGTLYLEHHGVTGQKHGVRRYQNYDGSLTPLGRIHYGYGQARSKAGPIVTNALKKTGQAAGILSNAFKETRQAAAAASEERRERKQAKLKEKASRDRSSVLRNRNLFTTKELEDLEKRFTAEDKLRANIPDKKALRKAAADQKEAEKLAERKEKASQTREGVLRNKKLFTNEELKALSERFNTEDKIKQESIDKGLAVVKNLANAAQSVQTIVGVFEDVSGYNISPIKRAQAEQKKAWDLEDRQRKQHFEDTKEAREEGKYKRETETWNKDQKRLDEKDKRDIVAWRREQQRLDAKEKREIESTERQLKRDRIKDQRERAERLIKKRQDAEDRARQQRREDAEEKRKIEAEIRKIKSDAAAEKRKAIAGKHASDKAAAEAKIKQLEAIQKAIDLSNGTGLAPFDQWLRTIDPNWKGSKHDSFDSDYVIQNGVLLVSPQGSSLAHYGIMGQKWGVRRFQNADGSLTKAGRIRYGVGSDGKMSDEGKARYKSDMEAKVRESSFNRTFNSIESEREKKIQADKKAKAQEYRDQGHPIKALLKDLDAKLSYVEIPDGSDDEIDAYRKQLEAQGYKLVEKMSESDYADHVKLYMDVGRELDDDLDEDLFDFVHKHADKQRYGIEEMTDEDRQKKADSSDESTMSDIDYYRNHAKELRDQANKMENGQYLFNKSLINKAMIEKLRKEADDDEWFAGELEATQLSKKGKAELAKQRKEESDREEAEFKKTEWMDAHEGTPKEETVRDGTPPFSDNVKKRRIEVAEKEDAYDPGFLEAIRNDWYFGDDSTKAKKERVKEYKKYLENPRQYDREHGGYSNGEFNPYYATADEYSGRHPDYKKTTNVANRVSAMASHYPVSKIAKELGISESRVRQIMADENIETKGTKVRNGLNVPSDYRQQPGYKKKAKHSSMESNYIIQNGVLMINPAERR